MHSKFSGHLLLNFNQLGRLLIDDNDNDNPACSYNEKILEREKTNLNN